MVRLILWGLEVSYYLIRYAIMVRLFFSTSVDFFWGFGIGEFILLIVLQLFPLILPRNRKDFFNDRCGQKFAFERDISFDRDSSRVGPVNSMAVTASAIANPSDFLSFRVKFTICGFHHVDLHSPFR
jgi:hypothetical protein